MRPPRDRHASARCVAWLFYAATGAFELGDIEGRDPLLANAVLISWIVISMLMMLNLLIAMFSDTYTTVRAATTAHHRAPCDHRVTAAWPP